MRFSLNGERARLGRSLARPRARPHRRPLASHTVRIFPARRTSRPPGQ